MVSCPFGAIMDKTEIYIGGAGTLIDQNKASKNVQILAGETVKKSALETYREVYLKNSSRGNASPSGNGHL